MMEGRPPHRRRRAKKESPPPSFALPHNPGNLDKAASLGVGGCWRGCTQMPALINGRSDSTGAGAVGWLSVYV